MIIEFIGSTSAGKTSLISEVQRKIAETTQVTTSFDLIAAPFGLSSVSDRMTRNFIQEIAVFPIFISTLRKNKAVIAFTLRMLWRHVNISFFTINNLRSIERKIGVYEKIRRYAQDQIILVDEGTIHLAHKVFVFSDAVYTSDEIAKFASLIPLPDLIVYSRVPAETLIQRTMQRPDPPREIRRNRSLTSEYINRAVAMFERIIEVERVKRRVLIVENLGSAGMELERAADYVSKSILKSESADELANTTSLQELWKN